MRLLRVVREELGLLEPETRGEAEPLHEDHVVPAITDDAIVDAGAARSMA